MVAVPWLARRRNRWLGRWRDHWDWELLIKLDNGRTAADQVCVWSDPCRTFWDIVTSVREVVEFQYEIPGHALLVEVTYRPDLRDSDDLFDRFENGEFDDRASSGR